MKQNNFYEELEFFSKQRGYRSESNCDVSVSVVRNTNSNKNKFAVSFIFRNRINEVITDSMYLVFAVKKNRIYFKGSDVRNGYKLVDGHSRSQRYMKATLSSEQEKTFKNFIGDYQLEYDEFHELYYIAKEV